MTLLSGQDAGVAHPVERHLAKVEVASSSLVTRSKPTLLRRLFFLSDTRLSSVDGSGFSLSIGSCQLPKSVLKYIVNHCKHNRNGDFIYV